MNVKEFLDQPGFLKTYGTFGVDLTFILAIFFTILFMVCWYYARKGRGNAHHALTLWAMLAMIGYFLFYYLSRQLGALSFTGGEGGQAGFGGPEVIYKWVFNPILTIHIIIVSVGLVMACYMIPLGFRTSEVLEGRRALVGGEARGEGKSFTRWVLLVSIALGLIFPTFRSLFRGYFSLRLYVDWVIVCVGIGLLVVLVEKLGVKFFRDGQRRHRALGTFTMVLYATALLTSTLTYFMLYVIYPPKGH
jgi:uncharacterized membrane protein YozB (DUF420 family)